MPPFLFSIPRRKSTFEFTETCSGQKRKENSSTRARFSHRLMARHGQANGVFGANECLADRDPSKGTETCVVVEMMESMAQMYNVWKIVSFLERFLSCVCLFRACLGKRVLAFCVILDRCYYTFVPQRNEGMAALLLLQVDCIGRPQLPGSAREDCVQRNACPFL
jgi:hypothetical protein